MGAGSPALQSGLPCLRPRLSVWGFTMRHAEVLPVVALSVALLAGCSSPSGGAAVANSSDASNAPATNVSQSQPQQTDAKVSTADFMAAAKSGLQSRWAATDEADDDSMTDDEYYDFLSKAVDIELAPVSRYDGKAFEDESLGEEAQTYIQALQDQKTAIAGIRSGVASDTSAWDGPAKRRADCLKDFRDKYGLSVDAEYQSNFDGVFEDAETYGEHVDEFTIVSATKGASSYGYVTIDVAVRNNTDYEKEFDTLRVSLLDSAGNIIRAEDRSFPEEVEPGQVYHMQITVEDTGNVAGLSSTGYAWVDSYNNYIEGTFSSKYKVMF